MKFKRHCPANHGAQAMREHLHQHYLQHVEGVKEPRRFHRLRKRLFWQIYVVVISSVLLVSALSGLLLHLRAQGVTHIPIIPLLLSRSIAPPGTVKHKAGGG
jgi:sirohydrochlorin ferrochelatase